MAQILQGNGYSTAAFGKWHQTPPREISAVGPFDRRPTGEGLTIKQRDLTIKQGRGKV